MIRDNVIVRLAAYYIAVLALFVMSILLFPSFADLQLSARAQQVQSLEGPVMTEAPSVTGNRLEAMFQPRSITSVGVGMLAALLLVLPLAWTYMWTRRPKKYRRALAQSLIALPVAVALVVFLVKDSLALAFSLAGVVAAIRWRTSLRDTRDAVFTFVAIGVGLAAGVQLVMVAFVASAFFNFLVLSITRWDVGRRPMQLDGWTLRPAAEHQVSATEEISQPSREQSG